MAGGELDVILAGGVVVDGSGEPRFAADVGVGAGLIAAVGDLSGTAAVRREDVSGLVVCPGFVDIHAHADIMTLAFPEAVPKIQQGITTEVVGNCGISAIPLSEGIVSDVRAIATAFDVPGESWDWADLHEFRTRVASAGPAVDIAVLAGHLNLRAAVVGMERRAATSVEIERMQRKLDDALAGGAVGMSLGLMYPPSSFATFGEMTALGEVLARRDALLAVHLRDYADGLLDAVDEMLEVAEAAGCRLQISHLAAVGRRNWGKVGDALARIDAAAGRGVDVAVDMYPYLAGSANLSQTVPEWALDGGVDALRARLADPATRERIAAAIADRPNRWEDVMLGAVPSDPPLAGRTIADLAVRWRRRPEDVVLDLLADGAPTMIAFGRSEDDLRAVFGHPRSMVGSDALVVLPDSGLPHPRAFGTYPRFLRRYVLDEQLVSLEDGIRMCTSAPADRIRLSDRGRIAVGARADLVAFDPEHIADTATYERPRRLPEGIEHVMVGGTAVVRNGAITGRRGGS